ncbi:Csu type fimbrial protein [Sphingomonas sp.]|uniref:Csu type fimbrial protein n=1 Tax=Sphingomonas sp. TaxID=28214 RepID=UPI003D6CD4BD
MTIRRLLLMTAALLGSLLIATPAQAACAQLSFCSCTVTATGISFGNYIPVDSTSNDSSGTVRVRCTLLLALAGSFTIDLSTGSSATYAQRTLRNGASVINYNLYLDPGRSQIFGNGTGGSSRITYNFAALLGVDQSFTVYGRIPARQNVPAGNYTDSIIVTVTY